MDGNMVQNIRDNFQWIAHFHRAARRDSTKSMKRRSSTAASWRRPIAELGFTGCMAHGYRPAPGRDPLKRVDRALEIMDV